MKTCKYCGGTGRVAMAPKNLTKRRRWGQHGYFDDAKDAAEPCPKCFGKGCK